MNSTVKTPFQLSFVKITLTLILLISLLVNGLAKSDASTDPLTSYPTQQIAKHIWCIFAPKDTPNKDNQGFMNNPVFVITDKSVVVFDPGSSERIADLSLPELN